MVGPEAAARLLSRPVVRIVQSGAWPRVARDAVPSTKVIVRTLFGIPDLQIEAISKRMCQRELQGLVLIESTILYPQNGEKGRVGTSGLGERQRANQRGIGVVSQSQLLADISDIRNSKDPLLPELFFYGQIPLLNILRPKIWTDA